MLHGQEILDHEIALGLVEGSQAIIDSQAEPLPAPCSHFFRKPDAGHMKPPTIEPGMTEQRIGTERLLPACKLQRPERRGDP